MWDIVFIFQSAHLLLNLSLFLGATAARGGIPPPWFLCTVVQGEVMERQEIGKRRKRIYSRIIYEGGGWRQRKRIQTEGYIKEGKDGGKIRFRASLLWLRWEEKKIFLKHFCSRGRIPPSFWLLLSLPSPKITCSGNFQFPAASETENIEQICPLARTEGGPVIDLTISPRDIRGLCTKTVITTPLSLSSSYWKAQSFLFFRGIMSCEVGFLSFSQCK